MASEITQRTRADRLFAGCACDDAVTIIPFHNRVYGWQAEDFIFDWIKIAELCFVNIYFLNAKVPKTYLETKRRTICFSVCRPHVTREVEGRTGVLAQR